MRVPRRCNAHLSGMKSPSVRIWRLSLSFGILMVLSECRLDICMDDDNNLGMVRILVAEVVANGNWPMRKIFCLAANSFAGYAI